MIVALQPSYWQQLVAGLAISIPMLIVVPVLLGWFSRSVLAPRAAGRPWPEGARGVRPIVELIVDPQRQAIPIDAANPERLVFVQTARFGLLSAMCAVLPLSTGLVVSRAPLGLYVLAVALLVDSFLRSIGHDSTDASDRLLSGVGLALSVGLAAGVVHAQWGTASLAGVVDAQANASIGGNAMWGLPTIFAHPIVFSIVFVAGYLSIVEMARARGPRLGGLPGLVAQIVNRGWIVVFSAWLIAAFAGGGAVPWPIKNPGTRQVLSVVLFSAKTTLCVVVLAWAGATWPSLSTRTARIFFAIAGIATTSSILGTLIIRQFA